MNGEMLRQLQLILLEMLVEVDRICKKCEIKYNIIAGTLLGAVRHGGYIPWDDDADVAFLRPESLFLDRSTKNFVRHAGRNWTGAGFTFRTTGIRKVIAGGMVNSAERGRFSFGSTRNTCPMNRACSLIFFRWTAYRIIMC